MWYKVRPLASDLWPPMRSRSHITLALIFSESWLKRCLPTRFSGRSESAAGMNVIERSNENATPAAEKMAKLLSGSMGLVTSEMKPAIVVTAANKTAIQTSLRPSQMASRCFSFVISPSIFLTAAS